MERTRVEALRIDVLDERRLAVAGSIANTTRLFSPPP